VTCGTVKIESKQSLCHVDISVTTPSHAAFPARSRPAAPWGSRGRRCPDAHAWTRMSAPSHAAPPASSWPTVPLQVPRPAVPRCACVDSWLGRPVHGQWSPLGPQTAVQLRVAPCSSAAVRSRLAVRSLPAGPVGSRCGRCLADSTGACGLVPVMRSRRQRSASGWAVRYGPW
jgi:hypothetical protein